LTEAQPSFPESRRVLRAIVTAVALSIVMVARASGQTPMWTVETVDTGLAPWLALDRDGLPHIAYSLTAREPRIANRAGSGWTFETFTTPDNALVSDGLVRNRPDEANLIYTCSVALGLDPVTDEPRLAWSQNWDWDVWYAQRAQGVWSYELVGSSVLMGSLQVDRTGLVHATFTDRYGVRSGGSWQVETPGFTGTLALDSQDHPHALFVTGPNEDHDLWYARRGPSGWTTEPVTSVGDVTAAQLAVDAAGRIHVAFFERTQQLVRYALRDGSGWSFQTIAGPTGHTSMVSIALGLDGEPCVSYWHLDRGDQYFARRDGGIWVSEVVDSAGSAGGPSSLVIDPTGVPRIAYQDQYGNRIRYATRLAPVVDVPRSAAVLGFAIERMAPNPLRAGAAIDLALRLDGERGLTVDLFDLAGRRVASRAPERVAAGVQYLRWSPGVAEAGLYFLSVRSDRGERLGTRIAILR